MFQSSDWPFHHDASSIRSHMKIKQSESKHKVAPNHHLILLSANISAPLFKVTCKSAKNFTPSPPYRIVSPPKLIPYPHPLPSKKVFIRLIYVNFYFLGNLNFFLLDLNSKIFEFDNKYVIRCLLSKYWPTFLLIFLFWTCLKACQILSRLVKISACTAKESPDILI